MYIFWDIIIKELIQVLKPQTILEIGSDSGLHTNQLLDYCLKNQSHLHVIDPNLKYDFANLGKEYKNCGTYHKGYSLDILPEIQSSNLVLIDGDHNWYTVFNELQLLRVQSVKKNQKFPFVLLHDTTWPYGRRDMYYDLEKIPAIYRLPNEKKGISFGNNDLIFGGVNGHLNNATSEGGDKNGVLTAIEDFLKIESELRFINIPFFHGLGILFDQNEIKANKDLENLINHLEKFLSYSDDLAIMERERLIGLIKNHNLKRSLNDILVLLDTNDEYFLIGKSSDEIKSLDSAVKKADVLLKIPENNLIDEEEEIQEILIKTKNDFLQEFKNTHNQNVTLIAQQLSQDKKISELNSSITKLEEENSAKIDELKGVFSRNKLLEENIKDYKTASKNFETKIEEIENEKTILEKSKQKLKFIIQNLEKEKGTLTREFKLKTTLTDRLKSELKTIENTNDETLSKLKHLHSKFEKLAKNNDKIKEEYKHIVIRYDSIKSKNNELINNSKQTNSQNLKILNSSKIIASEYDALINSWRWKIGNSFVRMVELFLFRKKIELASDRIQHEIEYLDEISKPIMNQSSSFQAKNDTLKESVFVPELNQPIFSIVITVHNALSDLTKCLNSIVKNSHCNYEVIIVNDFSDHPTSEYLENFTNVRENFQLINNTSNLGYTVSLNRGILKSKGQFVVLLNSDTIVPNNWLQKFKDGFDSDQNIGIIGPLSNAATWQSIPKVYDENGWVVNEIPQSTDLEIVNNILDKISIGKHCETKLLNGFCLAVKRNVFDSIGRFDEQAFPIGYGEENDFCIRSKQAGFKHVVLINLYVFHAKSKSFGTKNRKILSDRANTNLHDKHGSDLIKRLTDELKSNKDLIDLRNSFNVIIEKRKKIFSLNIETNVLFLLPVTSGSGGGHSVVQECYGMNQLGCNSKVAIRQKHTHLYEKLYPKFYKEGLFIPFSTQNELGEISKEFNVLVATIFTSVKMLEKIYQKSKHFIPAYYIQDYEPLFFDQKIEKELFKQAKESYTEIDEMVCFAKTDWLIKTVEEKHKVKVHKVKPSIDRDVYFASKNHMNTNNPIIFTAMVRPKTPRRAPEMTMEYLEKLKKKYKENIDIHIFGVEPKDPFLGNNRWEFNYHNHGILRREEVAKLLRMSDVFADLSDYQAFGRTGLEAMASGCAAILPLKGGVHEYAIHKENCILVNTETLQNCIEETIMLMDNLDLLNRIRKNGLQQSMNYNILEASISEIQLFQNQLKGKNLISKNS